MLLSSPRYLTAGPHRSHKAVAAAAAAVAPLFVAATARAVQTPIISRADYHWNNSASPRELDFSFSWNWSQYTDEQMYVYGDEGSTTGPWTSCDPISGYNHNATQGTFIGTLGDTTVTEYVFYAQAQDPTNSNWSAASSFVWISVADNTPSTPTLSASYYVNSYNQLVTFHFTWNYGSFTSSQLMHVYGDTDSTTGPWTQLDDNTLGATSTYADLWDNSFQSANEYVFFAQADDHGNLGTRSNFAWVTVN